MKSKFVLASAIFLLTGCAGNPSYLQSESFEFICVDQLTQAQSGASHDARAQEIARRGENCDQYVGRAQALLLKRQDQSADARRGSM